MKKILYVLGAIVILLVAAAIIIPLTFDPNSYKQDIARAVEEKSGYKLNIAGKIKLSVLPTVKAYADDVSVSAGSGKPFVKAKQIYAYVQIRPLLSGKIEIDEIKILEPEISLIQTGNSNNWTAKKPAQKAAAKEAQNSAKQELKVKDFSIVDGNVSYNNNGNAIKVQNINLSAGLNNDDLNLKKFTADIFGGSVKASGKVKLGDSPASRIEFDGKNFDLAQIAAGLMRNKRIERGMADLSGNLSANGMTPDRITASLNGAGKISAKDVVVRGFDVNAFATKVTNINSSLDLLPLVDSLRGENQSTKINSVAGDFSVKNGLVNLPGIRLEADNAQGNYSGTINLPQSTMNTEAKFNLLNADKKASPKIGLKISGAMSSPNINPDLSELTAWAVGKFGGKLLEKVPEKYQDFLKGFQGN